MNTIKPGALFLACIAFVALVVPIVIIIWSRANGFFFVHELGGQPRDIPTGWVFVVLGVIAAVLYALPAGLVFVAARRASQRSRSLLTLSLLALYLLGLLGLGIFLERRA